MPPDPVLNWLLESDQPAMRYLASRDLLKPHPGGRVLARLRSQVSRKGWAAKILSRQRERTWWVTKRTAYQPKFHSTIWQLQVLADLGMSREDERIANACEFWFDLHYNPKDGGYSDGTHQEGRLQSHLCTTGNMVRSLIRLGYLHDERVETAIQWLVDEQLPDGGWDCFGRKRGNLDSWEGMSALGEIPPNRRMAEVRMALAEGAEFFLRHRLLHEGAPFPRWRWLRYPWHYHYGVLVGLDFLSALPHRQDIRMTEALEHLASKRLPHGRWALDHSNGNLVIEPPRQPSKMVTFLARRIALRMGGKWKRRIEGS